MAISFIGQASGLDSVALPAHQAGDLILVHAYRGTSAVAPTLAAGFTAISSVAANSNGNTLGWKIAASSSEDTGVWANAEALVAHVYRGAHASPIGGSAVFTGIVTFIYPALTMAVADGSSWVAAFAGVRSRTMPAETVGAPLLNRSDDVPATIVAETAGHDTNGGVSSFAQYDSGSTTGGNRCRTVSVEIKAAATAPAGIVGTASITEAADAVSSSGALRIAGSASLIEADDAASGSSSSSIAGTASITEANDALAAIGKLPIAGSSSITEQGDAISSAGKLSISGSTALAEQGDVLSASGGTGALSPISGSAGITEAGDGITSSGALKIAGSLSAAEAGDSLAAAGALVVKAAAAITEAGDTLAAAGALPIKGTASIVEGNDSLAASSSSGVNGSASIAEALDILAASGGLKIVGSASISEEPDTATGIKKVRRKIKLAVVLTGPIERQVLIPSTVSRTTFLTDG